MTRHEDLQGERLVREAADAASAFDPAGAAQLRQIADNVHIPDQKAAFWVVTGVLEDFIYKRLPQRLRNKLNPDTPGAVLVRRASREASRFAPKAALDLSQLADRVHVPDALAATASIATLLSPDEYGRLSPALRRALVDGTARTAQRSKRRLG